MKQSLTDLAVSIKDGRAQAANSHIERIASERKKKEEAILESFKSTFFDFIPMIEEEGIVISAHFKSAYEHKGSFIQFQKVDRVLRMDYLNAIQYRYEYTNPDRDTIGRSVFGTWPKADLVLYIYDELLSKLSNSD
jgi:hypothetical protein